MRFLHYLRYKNTEEVIGRKKIYEMYERLNPVWLTDP